MKTNIATIRVNGHYTTEPAIRELIKVLKEKDISVLALQDIDQSTYTDLIRALKNAGYDHHRFPDIHEDIFHKPRAKACDKVRFKSTDQARGWTMYNLEFGTEQVLFITGILEEGARGLVNRKKQIKEIGSFFGTHKYVVFMGDTCITSFQKGIDKPNGWYDAWEELGNHENEFTYDGGRNSFVNVNVRDRRERIWYKGVYSNEFGMLSDHFDPPISDHFGIWAEIEFDVPDQISSEGCDSEETVQML